MPVFQLEPVSGVFEGCLREDATASGPFSAAISGLDLLAGADASERGGRACVRKLDPDS